MAYVGERFESVHGRGMVSVQVDTDGADTVYINGERLSFEQAEKLANFITTNMFKVKKERGDYDRW